MKNLKELYLKTNNKEITIKTQNYLLDQESEIIKDFSDAYFELSSSELEKLQEKMSSLHCQHEMNFQIKDESGKYNKIVATPFHGFAPIKKDLVDSLVSSCVPLLKQTRALLQNLFSTDEITAKSLKIDHLPKEVSNELIEIIKNNIYFEPMYRHKNLKDYPFLSVVGFDSAVSNLEKAENVFFEFNAGTPCGIEDQYQLFYHFKDNFPKLADKILPYVPKDQSHQNLKQVIDECAQHWTKNSKGISVVLGPGSYNPAHPEIAAIAVRSGMPLVKIQDLYVDQNGDVRLSTLDQEHPIVTGIYNRKEESFLMYSEKYNIPLRSPFTSQNQELSKQVGHELKEGILYSYTYDENFNITGVDIDQKAHRPKYQVLFEQIAKDPKTNVQGDLIKCVWEKKLYVSNLGGRVFDDKRAFRIIHKYLCREQKTVAHPPKSLHINELPESLSEAVIKAPDLSGGAGVIIGAQLSEKEKEKTLKDINSRPDYYEIQKLTPLAVVTTMQDESYTPLPIDWRLIITFDPTNKAHCSTHSCLVRTAPFGSIKTNTSAGGGYALGLIYQKEKCSQNHHTKIKGERTLLTQTRKKDLESFYAAMEDFFNQPQKDKIEPITYKLRDIMDLIGIENISFINNLRDYQQGLCDLERLKSEYTQFRGKIFP